MFDQLVIILQGKHHEIVRSVSIQYSFHKISYYYQQQKKRTHISVLKSATSGAICAADTNPGAFFWLSNVDGVDYKMDSVMAISNLN